jgi:hypothetical protein
VDELAATHARAVLEALVDRDSRLASALDFAAASELLPELSRSDVDDALVEALDDDLIVGDRSEGDGSVAGWSRVRLTARGPRLLGQWPPAGREWEPGGWDTGCWGRRARPLLQRLRDHPPSHGFLFKPIGEASDRRQEWTAALLLRDADLISGRHTEEGIDTLRLAAAGQQALDPRPRDPLDHALVQLRSGARVDAIVTAVELALGTRLKLLAAKRGVAVTHPDGSPLKFAALNTNLRAAGAYDETHRAQVEAWFKLRNDLAHAHVTTPSDARIEAVIAGVRTFLADHPA